MRVKQLDVDQAILYVRQHRKIIKPLAAFRTVLAHYQPPMITLAAATVNPTFACETNQ